MVAMWFLMFVLTCVGLFLWKRNRLDKSPWVLKGLVVSVAFPMIANEVGWVTAEMGRQPWIGLRPLAHRRRRLQIDQRRTGTDIDHHVLGDLCVLIRAFPVPLR